MTRREGLKTSNRLPIWGMKRCAPKYLQNDPLGVLFLNVKGPIHQWSVGRERMDPLIWEFHIGKFLFWHSKNLQCRTQEAKRPNDKNRFVFADFPPLPTDLNSSHQYYSLTFMSSASVSSSFPSHSLSLSLPLSFPLSSISMLIGRMRGGEGEISKPFAYLTLSSLCWRRWWN